MRFSDQVLAVLDRATIQGNSLSLTALGQLDRKLYTDTNKVLEAAGGKWDRRAKAHLFEGDAAEAVEPILLTGEVVSVRQELQQFYTPPELARRVIAEAQIAPGMMVLEPSAGRGALAAEALMAGATVDCVELDPRYVHLLCSTPYEAVVQGDFLKQGASRAWDRVVMNPPYAKGQDIQHVQHAWRFLKPGGRLVAIMSTGFMYRTRGNDLAFRDDLQRAGAKVEILPEGAFKASGTAVRTCLVTIGVR
ncbi:methyltransferase [Methylobacterium sp. E-041]|uniref:methyltransferase n=1 Tax=Methylobacterium sp. E-041 TaxID=2836573 RepID=UPI001FBAF755|nr:methyltransferase [Methylobacterium sp. E-041]MCJ2104731.1 methyltransferase [Methylobacterium sp. E-041]